jgi:hypothetical protein
LEAESFEVLKQAPLLGEDKFKLEIGASIVQHCIPSSPPQPVPRLATPPRNRRPLRST